MFETSAYEVAVKWIAVSRNPNVWCKHKESKKVNPLPAFEVGA